NKGRLYCNTICPVGSFLGLLSKYSYRKPRINDDMCVHCGKCEQVCKASCIDAKSAVIDYTRCVACFNCIDSCPQGGLQYAVANKSTIVNSENEVMDVKSSSRRNFLTFLSLFTVMIAKKAYAQNFDGGLALIKDKMPSKRLTTIIPPGSLSVHHLRRHCTGCQLCVSVCPNSILKPTETMNGFMQPEISYEKGYCRPECVKCSDVCPTSAIEKITSVEKSAIQIGHAIWNEKLCIVNTDKVSCDNCARHCPTGAIKMVTLDSGNPLSLKIPMVDETRCIGCGACENLCPSRPYSAIYVEGHERHQTI
ncbi:MAG: 4Fe-4S dicluster domain-containing protein, partial [Vampirovibrionia bacterium]